MFKLKAAKSVVCSHFLRLAVFLTFCGLAAFTLAKPLIAQESASNVNSAQLWPITEGLASWYSTEACQFNPHKGCPTASGKSLYALEKEKINFAAMFDVPLGSEFIVTNKANNKSAKVVILDRGPNKRLGRKIDLSRSAFNEIAELDKGLIEVKLERIK